MTVGVQKDSLEFAGRQLAAAGIDHQADEKQGEEDELRDLFAGKKNNAL